MPGLNECHAFPILLLESTFLFYNFHFVAYDIPSSLHQLWLLHYYMALAVRENILAVNGSDIQTWWILHHYFSMALAVVTLLWPAGPSFARFERLFHTFLIFQGCIMVLQNNYQSARHYVRRRYA